MRNNPSYIEINENYIETSLQLLMGSSRKKFKVERLNDMETERWCGRRRSKLKGSMMLKLRGDTENKVKDERLIDTETERWQKRRKSKMKGSLMWKPRGDAKEESQSRKAYCCWNWEVMQKKNVKAEMLIDAKI